MELKPGTLLHNDKYKIEKTLGHGSFGITYLATAKISDTGNLGRMEVYAKVAIKEFFMNKVNSRNADGSSVEGSSGEVFTDYRRKFRKEAENLSKLDHPSIVKVYDVFDENGTTYYSMEFLEGTSLDDYIKSRGSLPEDEAVAVAGEIGGALSYMHSKNMLHLDVKPKNVMRRAGGGSTLIDFGLSKQYTDYGEPESSTTIGLGTPGYAPLEQAGYRQDGTFPATLDVYALGATLFKMLTGHRPPEASVLFNNGFPLDELTDRGVSDDTCRVLQKAMAPSKKSRYQDVQSFINALSDSEGTAIDDPQPKPKPLPQPIPQPVPAVPIKNRQKSKRSKLLWACAAAILVGIIGIFMSDIVIVPASDGDDLISNARNYQNEFEAQDSNESAGNVSGSIINGHDYVDLGLSVKWATCNVGASTPSDYGNYYAWGETTTKSEYTTTNSKTRDKSIGDISGNAEYDAARANWGGTWRLPTMEECQELVDRCTWKWTSQGGHTGYKVTGPNGKTIFLPTAGWRSGSLLADVGVYGRYWSSAPYEDEDALKYAYSIGFATAKYNNITPGLSNDARISGLPIRPVSE